MVNKKVYAALVLLRLLVALTSTSTIHPDEHFQNPEVAASLVFDYGEGDGGLLKTWEWVGSSPIRCIVPVVSSVGAAFGMLKMVGGAAPSARDLFLAQRSVMWALSLIIDWTISRSTSSDIPLLLFATAPITFSFLVRPFSNSLETILYAVALYLVGRIIKARGKDTSIEVGALGSILAMGVFARVTFLAFAVPLVGSVVLSAVSRIKGSVIAFLFLEGLPALLGFVASSLILAAIDTLHFTSLSLKYILSSSGLSSLIITPLNSFRFNLSTSNLAAHGIHPRYLHALVNWPMLVGVGVWGMLDVVLRRRDPGKEKIGEVFMKRVYVMAIVLPMLVLSIQPHQEPRFLVPMIVPLVLLLKDASFFKSGARSGTHLRRMFWTLWLTHSVLFTIFFGYLHQGGLVTALLSINDGLRTPGLPMFGSESTSTKLEFVFWQTFMPPRHLLLPLPHMTTPSIRITDRASSPPTTLYNTLQNLSSSSTTLILVSPSWALPSLPLSTKNSEDGRPCLKPLFSKTFGIHLDTDRLDEVWEGGWEGLGVGAWMVDPRCLEIVN